MSDLTIIKDTTVKGKRRVTVALEPGMKLIAVGADLHYKLGYPHGDIIHANQLLEAQSVMWCVVEQKWVE